MHGAIAERCNGSGGFAIVIERKVRGAQHGARRGVGPDRRKVRHEAVERTDDSPGAGDRSQPADLRDHRCRGAQAALEALPVVAAEVGASEELVRRLRKEYEEHAALVEAGDAEGSNEVTERNDLLRRVRLGVLEHKRRAITELRDQNRIDDIILRELQSVMDLEEVRLLEPADTE